MIKHTKAINVKLTEDQHNKLLEIRSLSGRNVSAIIRDNLTFLSHYYRENNFNDTKANNNEKK